MNVYWRPIPEEGGALPLAGGWLRFSRVERLQRGRAPRILPADAAPADVLAALTAPRDAVMGVAMDRPSVMGIVNATPDSFSDGGSYDGIDHGRALIAEGADLLDIGGAGAGLVNDVSGFDFDADLARVVAEAGVPVCLMHAQGLPATMQDDPRYGDVLLDVYDALAARVARAEAAGIPRARILVDPGIGFGKTLDHNLAILARIGLFHGLGCAILLGVSRKRFIGQVAGQADARARMPGTVAVTLASVGQGVQMHRVHDVAATVQALALWRAVTERTGR